MRRWLTPMLLLAVLAVFSGCSNFVKQDPFAPFQHRANIYDLQFAWNTAPRPGGMDVRGIVKNVRYAAVDDLVLYLALVDQGNREVERQVCYPIPNPVAMDEWRPFQVTFHHPAPPGGKLRFQYQYRALEDHGGFTWMNSFDVDLATGMLLKKE